jgi:hypothetical protein
MNKKMVALLKITRKKAYSEVIPPDDRMTTAYFGLKH